MASGDRGSDSRGNDELKDIGGGAPRAGPSPRSKSRQGMNTGRRMGTTNHTNQESPPPREQQAASKQHLENILRFGVKARGLARKTKNLIKKSGSQAKASPKKFWQRIKQIRDAKRVKEQRHQPRLVEEEDYLTEGYCNEAALVTDVQIFDKLYEDAPSDLRHLFWSACSKRKTNPFENFREAWFEMNAIHDSMYSNHSTSSSHVTPVASPSQNNGLAHDRWKTEEKKFTDVSENPTSAAAAPTAGPQEQQQQQQEEEADRSIKKDLDRIFPGHEYLDSEAMKDVVYSILRAYSLHDTEVGYCQGMAYMATLTALYMTEQDAFQLVVELMGESGCNLRSIYKPGLGELQEMLLELDERMEQIVPAVSRLFRDCHVQTMLFATNWILTLYASSFPIVMTCRLIDIMLSEGNISILLRVALSILKVCERDLLQCYDTEEVMSYLQTKCYTWTSEQLRSILTDARDLELKPKKKKKEERQPLEQEGKEEKRETGKGEDCGKPSVHVRLSLKTKKQGEGGDAAGVVELKLEFQ